MAEAMKARMPAVFGHEMMNDSDISSDVQMSALSSEFSSTQVDNWY